MRKVIDQWLCNKIQHKSNADYLVNVLNAENIAIYGAGKYGEYLYDELLECKMLKIAYFIDKNADSLYYGIDDMNIYNLSEVISAEKVDTIVVTPINYFDDIKSTLLKTLDYTPNIISLEELVNRTE